MIGTSKNGLIDVYRFLETQRFQHNFFVKEKKAISRKSGCSENCNLHALWGFLATSKSHDWYVKNGFIDLHRLLETQRNQQGIFSFKENKAMSRNRAIQSWCSEYCDLRAVWGFLATSKSHDRNVKIWINWRLWIPWNLKISS